MAACDLVFKFTVVGTWGVGKSALCTQFADKKFLPDHVTTLGADVISRTITINGKTIKLQTWDTSGQERFLSVTQSYFKGSAGVLLVYDVTNRKSFDALQFWLRNIHEYSRNPNIVIYLVGNKSDMTHDRVVKQEEGEQFSRKYGLAGFLETSAKTAENVEVAFTSIAVEINEKIEAGVFDTGNQANGVKLVPQRFVDRPENDLMQRCPC